MPQRSSSRHDVHSALMRECVAEARLAQLAGDVPVGALIVDDRGTVLARAHNQREISGDPTAHAEVLAMRRAGELLGDWRLVGCTLVVTLEPCVMCAGAILAARIPTLVFGAWDPKAGAVGSVLDLLRDRRLNHRVEVISGVDEQICAEQLADFFRRQRNTSA